MQVSKTNKADYAIFGIYRLLASFFVLFTLYFAQTIVIPLTLAALLTFLLSPLVTRLEKWIGRIFSILLIVIVAFSAVGFAGYVLIRQMISFGSNFPNYYENIQKKLQAFRFPEWEIFNRISHLFASFKEELFGSADTLPLDVKLIDLSSHITNFAQWISGSFFNLIAVTGIVILLVIFMLLNREDIRSRLIKLIGQDQISSTASTLDDASERVYTYLFRQFIVNISFGICIFSGLYLIGVPNPVLWGCFAAIMRFIPYLGSWIAALLPIALSFIITDTWSVPLLTIAFFITAEITTAYFIEPLYYGVGTGVSPFALILAAIFWTWLWGPIGLLLSIPLTVCLVVMGQHMNMKFLSVLLSEEKALTPVEECYHRLLSFDSSASMEVIESYLKKDSLISLYDSIMIPIISQTEIDYDQDLIDVEKKENVYQNIREIVEFLSITEAKEIPLIPEAKATVLCCPARNTRDELGVNILAELLIRESLDVQQLGVAADIFEYVEKTNPNAVCITAVAPFSLSHHIQYLCTKLRRKKPQLPIFINLLGFSQVNPEIIDKLKAAGATKVTCSLAETVKEITHPLSE